MRRLLVAGMGKMGRNIGLHFARQGWQVGWFSRDQERQERGERWLGRRLRKISGGAALGFMIPGATLPEVDILIEAVEEDRASKVELLARLDRDLPTKTTRLLSTTSSILPGEIHPRLSVAHFFYPLEFTGMVELVPGPAQPGEEGARLGTILSSAGLEVLVEDQSTAFLLNRLLLPLQSECFRALIQGLPAEQVEEASAASPLCPVGQLGLMDSVGLDVVAAAVEQYLARMPEEGRRAHEPLRRGLAHCLCGGRRGNKGGGGLLRGEPLDWGEVELGGGRDALAPELWPALVLRTCKHLVDQGMVEAGALDSALVRLFGAETTVAAETGRLGKEGVDLNQLSPYFRVDAGREALFI